jgi:hypothetical protein
MSRKTLLPALAACALLAVGAPAASASKAHVSSANTAKAIKFLLQANKNRASEIGALTDQVSGLTSAVKSIRGVLDPIVSAAPTIINGLTALKDGLTTVGAGLTKLGAAYNAVEYGAVRAYYGNTELGVIQSADIPDDGNVASFSGTLPFPAPAGGSIVLRAAIRSNETDGQHFDFGDPAGQVGVALTVTCGTATGCAGGAVPVGTIVCGAGTTSHTYNLPDGSTTSQKLVNIQLASGRTQTSEPTRTADGYSVDPLEGQSCSLPGAGTYAITVSGAFADIPTSTSPGPTD